MTGSPFRRRAVGDGVRVGWHSPVLAGTAEVAHFINAAFVHGVWIANRHTAFRNGVPEDEIAAAKAALLDCAARGQHGAAVDLPWPWDRDDRRRGGKGRASSDFA